MSTAFVNQFTEKGIKSDWIVKDTKENVLATLPKALNEQHVFELLEVLRKNELHAFNEGIDFQKTQASQELTNLRNMVRSFDTYRNEMRRENARLADLLDKATRGLI